MHYTIDFHTHSIFSPDGAITKDNYARAFAEKKLDVAAITDHHSVEYALYCQKKLGEKIVVGEEMTSLSGHIIGLFLKKTIPSGLSLEETIERIHAQEGLVYVPHPFDIARRGIGADNMERIKEHIDVVEFFNARVIFRGQNALAEKFAAKHQLAIAVGSDSHSSASLGVAYTRLPHFPSVQTLQVLLTDATYQTSYLPWVSYLQPKFNRIRKRVLYER